MDNNLKEESHETIFYIESLAFKNEKFWMLIVFEFFSNILLLVTSMKSNNLLILNILASNLLFSQVSTSASLEAEKKF